MELNAYLHFNGNCDEAFKFYEKVLGGKGLMKMTYGEAPPHAMPPGFDKSKVMHARIQVGNTILMGSDAPPERFHKPQGFSSASASTSRKRRTESTTRCQPAHRSPCRSKRRSGRSVLGC